MSDDDLLAEVDELRVHVDKLEREYARQTSRIQDLEKKLSVLTTERDEMRRVLTDIKAIAARMKLGK